MQGRRDLHDRPAREPERLRRPVRKLGPRTLARVQTPDDDHDRVQVRVPRSLSRTGSCRCSTRHRCPRRKDDKQNYDFHPVSSGPYKILELHAGQVAQRWSAAPTGIRRVTRTARLCRTASSRPSASTCPRSSQRLIADQGADKNAVTLENSGAIQNADLPKIKEPSVECARSRTARPPCVDYECLERPEDQ